MSYIETLDPRGAEPVATSAAPHPAQCKYCFVGGCFVGPPGDGAIHENSAAGRLSAALFGALAWLLAAMLGLPPLLLLLVAFA